MKGDLSTQRDEPSLITFVRRLNKQWRSNKAFQSFKKYTQAATPFLYGRLKNRVATPLDWIDFLSPKEQGTLSLLEKFNPTPEEISRNNRLNTEFSRSRKPVKTINWFIPYVNHVYAGVYTILRFAARLQSYHCINNKIIIYDNPEADVLHIQKQLEQSFPVLVPNIWIYSGRGLAEIPASDVCMATYWPSAYLVSKVTNTRAKFYFIQDYESLFYAAGTVYGLVEATYRLGLRRIVNTPGLLEVIKYEHGGEGVAFIPSIDRTLYFPYPEKQPGAPKVKVFFYGRPSEERNGFMLGIEALRRVKAKYGERVEIVAAGGNWREKDYGAEHVLRNLGILTSLQEVAALYRSCDIGLVFMFTKHPSYQPFEFMASGCCVVSNRNSATEWMLKDRENALLTEPTVVSVAAAIGTLIENPTLRAELREAGLRSITRQGWDETIDNACREASILPTA